MLRGPQGTLFGEGSMGGSVRILTQGADLNNWEVKALGMVSGTDGGGTNTGIKGALNAPIIPFMLGLRISGTTERYEGWLDDRATGRRNLNDQSFDTIRAKLLFKPTDRLSITGSYRKSDSAFRGGGSAGSDNGQISQSAAVVSELNFKLYGGTIRYDLGGAEAFYGYSHNDMALPQGGSFLGGTVDAGIGIAVTSHELRLASKGEGPLQWTLGGHLRKANRSDRFIFALFGLNNSDTTRSKASAPFGEALSRRPACRSTLPRACAIMRKS